MNNFRSVLPGTVEFGWGSAGKLGGHIRAHGNRALVFTISGSFLEAGIANNIFDSLTKEGVSFEYFQVEGEPTASGIEDLRAKIADSGSFDAVAAIGGGSVMDTAKAISALYFQSLPIQDFLDPQAGAPEITRALPVIALPTSFASCSQATPFSYLKTPDAGKQRLSGVPLMPSSVLVDASMTLTLEPEASVFSAVSCLASLVESYVSAKASALCDPLIIDAIERVVSNIDRLGSRQHGIEARENLSYAAFISGVGAANSAHTVLCGLAHAIGSLYDIPHASLMTSLLYPAMLTNMRKAQMFDPDSDVTGRFSRVGAALSGLGYDTQRHAVLLRAASDTLLRIRKEHSTPSLRELGVRKDDFYRIATLTDQDANPVTLAETEVMDVLEMSY